MTALEQAARDYIAARDRRVASELGAEGDESVYEAEMLALELLRGLCQQREEGQP